MNSNAGRRVRLVGRVASGVGEGAHFTRLAWARDQFIAKLGIDPFPGTLNLMVEDAAGIAALKGLRARPGIAIRAPDGAWCDARCYRVSMPGAVTGAMVWPELPAYPEAQIEIISAERLRHVLDLADGDRLVIEVAGVPNASGRRYG